jgi:hypothetical protein
MHNSVASRYPKEKQSTQMKKIVAIVAHQKKKLDVSLKIVRDNLFAMITVISL